jgi:Tol biopolymer transport system component
VGPTNEPEPEGLGLVFRAADPNALQVVPLTPPDASPLTFAGFYGSQLIRLGYVPANSKWADRIAFASNRDGNTEVYVMGADGSNPVNLTQNAAYDDSPAWSPDGTRIAFASYRDGNWEVYVMGADGSNPVNLTQNSATDYVTAWSPDGTRLAFASTRDGNYEVYRMGADG